MTSLAVTKESIAVIFLDIDGVLMPLNSPGNKELYKQGQKLFNKYADFSEMEVATIKAHFFSTDALKNLDALIRKVQNLMPVRIVISSAWRLGFTVEQLQNIFSLHSFSKLIIDKTLQGLTRGFEIHSWLQKHRAIERYVILDDNDHGISDIYSDHFVQISHLLSEPESKFAYDILMREAYFANLCK